MRGNVQFSRMSKSVLGHLPAAGSVNLVGPFRAPLSFFPLGEAATAAALYYQLHQPLSFFIQKLLETLASKCCQLLTVVSQTATWAEEESNEFGVDPGFVI